MSGRGGGSIIDAGAEAAKRSRLERIVRGLRMEPKTRTKVDQLLASGLLLHGADDTIAVNPALGELLMYLESLDVQVLDEAEQRSS